MALCAACSPRANGIAIIPLGLGGETMIYRFGDCALDTNLYTVQRRGQTLRLRPKVFRVCLYLLEHRDHVVTREELCAQVWAGRFIRQATLEGVVRSVRQAVGDNGRTQGIIQTLHGYGYRFVAAVEERPAKREGGPEPPASALLAPSEPSPYGQTNVVTPSATRAPELEPTLDPVHQSESSHGVPGANGHVVRGRSVVTLGNRPAMRPRALGGRRLIRMGVALVLGLLGFLGGGVLWHAVRERAAVPLEKPRIAVLPFIDLSAEADHSYFADGMTEELIAQLSQIRGVTVIARTSVMKYKGTMKDVATIGRELMVGTILEGSVRRAENHVRISAQLIDVASQGHIWSQEYERELTGVFDIQSDIATHVAQQLEVQLTAGEKRGGQVERMAHHPVDARHGDLGVLAQIPGGLPPDGAPRE